jgi:hypothetical protein
MCWEAEDRAGLNLDGFSLMPQRSLSVRTHGTRHSILIVFYHGEGSSYVSYVGKSVEFSQIVSRARKPTTFEILGACILNRGVTIFNNQVTIRRSPVPIHKIPFSSHVQYSMWSQIVSVLTPGFLLQSIRFK